MSLKPVPLYSGSGSPMHAVAAFITRVYFYVALGLPSSVVLHFGEPILTGFETTAVECTAVGGASGGH